MSLQMPVLNQTQAENNYPQAQGDSPINLSFKTFFKAIPVARAICEKYQHEYTDEHSKWLGRWVKRAERHMQQSSHASDIFKKELTDKLIKKLVAQILVSPYDRSPFMANTEKRPVLFKGLIFPHWMLEDILILLGNPNGMRQAKPHELMNEMLEWTKALQQPSPSILSENRALVPRDVGGTLVVANQTRSPSHLDNALLVSLNFSEHPELTIIKLLAYRDLIRNVFREMELRKMNKATKRQLKQIVRFGEKQKALAEQEKVQSAQERVAHEQAVNRQFEDISQIQESTQNIMREHFQSLIDQMNQAEERMKKLQQECKDKEAQVQSLQAAQRSLNH